MQDAEATGERVLDEAVRAARRVFGRPLEAAFALGAWPTAASPRR
jgi:hypothetical protein